MLKSLLITMLKIFTMLKMLKNVKKFTMLKMLKNVKKIYYI